MMSQLKDDVNVNERAEQNWLKAILLTHGQHIFERCAHFYAQLTSLPRRIRRRLKVKAGVGLTTLALALALSGTPTAHAGTLTVDGTTCTLADAISSANTGVDTGGCVGGSAGADIIDLQTDVLLTSALPDINSEITLEGNGHTIDGNNGRRVLSVVTGGNLTLNEATITGGNAGEDGGGLQNENGIVTINNSTISGNAATSDSGTGGGINNYASGAGQTATMTLNNSTISGNTANVGGGGIMNYAEAGGTATMTLNNSTVSGNTATGSVGGGGIMNYTAEGAGNSITIILNNATISGNTASQGGGIYNGGYGDTIAITLNRSIVSGNSATDSGDEIFNYGSYTVTANNNNVLGHNGYTTAQAFDGFTPSGSDINATSDGAAPTALADILTTTLADNGGPTLTHALVSGSPAIDAAPAGDCSGAPISGIDQRGEVRAGGAYSGGSGCDAGAFEYHKAYSITVDGTICTLADAITSANTDAATGGCAAGGAGLDIIDLQTAVLLSSALPTISSPITLEGNGHTINGNSSVRVLHVARAGELTLNEATLTGGRAPFGAGLYNEEGTVTVNDSTISGNLATGSGGGIVNYSDNSSYPAMLVINNSTIANNSANHGGGIWNYSEGGSVSLELNNSTISGNAATAGSGDGGGIWHYVSGGTGILTLNSSTITGNSATGSGGGISISSGATAIITLNRSLISGNTAVSGREIWRSGGSITANQYNVFGHNGYTNNQAFSGFTPSGTDFNATSNNSNIALASILNTTLADNGGVTLTHALVLGSPAIDLIPTTDGNCNPGGSVDQRGAARANGTDQGGAACDAGAFEYDATETPTAVFFGGGIAQGGAANLMATLLSTLLLAVGTAWAALRRKR